MAREEKIRHRQKLYAGKRIQPAPLEERERREIEILEEKVKKDAAVSRKEAIGEMPLPPRRDGRKK